MIDRPWIFKNLNLDELDTKEIQVIVNCISNINAPKTPLFEDLEDQVSQFVQTATRTYGNLFLSYFKLFWSQKAYASEAEKQYKYLALSMIFRKMNMIPESIGCLAEFVDTTNEHRSDKVELVTDESVAKLLR